MIQRDTGAVALAHVLEGPPGVGRESPSSFKVSLIAVQSSLTRSLLERLEGLRSLHLEPSQCSLTHASEALARDQFRPDLVLLFDDFPGGLTHSLRQLRKQQYSAPVIVVADEADAAEAELYRLDGACDVLTRRHALASDVPLLERSILWALERENLSGDLRRARELGFHLAHHDPLTDLPNRQLFKHRLHQALAQARRHDRQLAVLFLDLDRFKQINDSLGHSAGDSLLREVAGRLQACIRETDLASRRGGDEFNVLLGDIRRGQDAARVARKIARAICEPLAINENELFTSASIGISLFPADGEDVDTLVKHADIAMYQAKAEGGGKFRFFLPQMTDRAIERLALEGSLRAAIEREEFVLYYQPRIDAQSSRIVGVEALVRWQHPSLGLIYPDEFVPVAEETGLINGLGEWVMREACTQFMRWRQAGIELENVAVNVSARQFQQKTLVETVRNILSKTGMPAQHLEIEITESAVMQDARVALETLKELRQLGAQVAIDDFGTGQSSLAYLKLFPITKLKIDKVFIRSLLTDPKDAAITQAIIDMAHSLGLSACAEGVETRNQLEYLRGVACDELQGYVFSPPLPSEYITALLSRQFATVGSVG